MGIIELLQRVGEESIMLQNLVDVCSGARQSNGAVEVSFYTDQTSAAAVTGITKGDKIGLVIWLPRDKVPKEVL